MFGSSLTEVPHGTLKRFALFKIEIAASGTVSNRNESAQKVLDPAMAVSEQRERILAEVSLVVSSDLHRHVASVPRDFKRSALAAQINNARA
jgi:hypothetical protein